MGKAAPLPIASKAGIAVALALAIAFSLGACQRNALQLPPDLSHLPPEERLTPNDLVHADAKLDCPALLANAAKDREVIKELEQAIAANRSHNQTVGYVASTLFPPLWFAARTDSDVKATLDSLLDRRDRLERLVAARKCRPAGPA
jgi:hypothetical protein